MSGYGRVGVFDMSAYVRVGVFDMSAYGRIGVLICQHMVVLVF